MESICLRWSRALTKLTCSSCWPPQPQKEKGNTSSPELFPFLINITRRGEEVSSWRWVDNWVTCPWSAQPKKLQSTVCEILAPGGAALGRQPTNWDQTEEVNPIHRLVVRWAASLAGAVENGWHLSRQEGEKTPKTQTSEKNTNPKKQI